MYTGFDLTHTTNWMQFGNNYDERPYIYKILWVSAIEPFSLKRCFISKHRFPDIILTNRYKMISKTRKKVVFT